MFKKQRKPTKTLSGVTPVAVVVKPQKCKHGTCLYCPSFDVPQSYTPRSPAIMRAMALDYNPKKQIIALAKREEQIFRPGKSEPLELSLDSPALKLLQRLRDEAHRFAISFNRNLRQKSATKSILTEVPGIGPLARKKLLTTFGSVAGVRSANDEKLLKIISPTQLQSLRKIL